MLSMDVVPASNFDFFLRRLRKSFANRAGRNLRSRRNQYVVAPYLEAMHTGICPYKTSITSGHPLFT